MPFGDTPTPYFPGSARTSRFGCGIGLILMLIALVIIGTISIYALKLAVRQGATLVNHADLHQGRELFGVPIDSSLVALVIASILNTLFITMMNAIYRKLGIVLTNWENHRTESEYEDYLIHKNFLFQVRVAAPPGLL